MFIKNKFARVLCKLIIKAALPFMLISFSFSGFSQTATSPCRPGSITTIAFRSNSVLLLPTALFKLDSLSNILRRNKTCLVNIFGYSSTDKASLQLGSQHIEVVKNYLVKYKGIAVNRLIIYPIIQSKGDPTKVDLKIQ